MKKVDGMVNDEMLRAANNEDLIKRRPIESTREAIDYLNGAIRILHKYNHNVLAAQLDDIRQFIGRDL